MQRHNLLFLFASCTFAILASPATAQVQEPQAPEPLRTSIRVVGQVSTETPANISIIDTTQLAETPGIDLDDRLRDVPGFTLFRRSSSVVANPTTQGVSLRGVGSSGASRTLVLWDSVPVNDPFGGWVYWTQFVPDEIQSVEISRGASTSVFGDRAMSGAIGIFSRAAEPYHLLGDYDGGSENTQDVSLGFSNPWPGVAVSGVARGFTTDGYYIVPASIRGAVDRPANVRFATADLHVDFYNLPGALFFKIDTLAEERGNGTELTHNSTGFGTASLHYVRDWAHDSLSLLGYGTEEGFHSTFSSVLNNRNTERLTYTQTVPSEAEGGAAFWQHRAGGWSLVGGTDMNRVDGTDTDHLLPTGLRVGGGTQLQNGFFAQADGTWGPVHLYGGLRESLVHQRTTSDNFLSPSAGAAYSRHRLRLRAAVYRAFRAPTLNELYRSFSVGNTFTEANPNLRPETLSGAEAGVDWTGESSSIRLTAYRNSIDNLVTNVTLSSTPTAIVRQRGNAAAALSRGVEAAFHRRMGPVSAELNYLYADSRYVTGYRIEQVPRHQGSGRVAYVHGGTMLSVDARAFDYQFDDDLNQYRLPGYAQLELGARQRISGPLSAHAEVENALDRVYYTAFTPTPNIGQPRLWQVGLRWEGRVK
jgi:outer membrane cobalamin receptor